MAASRVRRSFLSVIMPVYNVEGYLAEAVHSVLSQSHRKLELILVDDGSTDTSGQMCDQFALDDSRVRVIHKANAGLGAARNTGIAAASGEFIAFVDSDDYLLPRAYEAMIGTLRRSGSDMVTANVLRRQGRRTWQAWNQSRSHVKDRRAITLEQLPELLYDGTAWNKMYRRKFFDEHVGGFPEDKLFEDMVPSFEAMINASSIDVLSRAVYVWRLRDEGDSITQRRLELRNVNDRFEMVATIKDAISARGLDPSLGEQMSDKVLEGDLWIYVREMVGADDTMVGRLAELSRHYWLGASERSKLVIPPERRICYWLLCNGRGREVPAFRAWYQSVNDAPPMHDRDGKLMLDVADCSVSLDGVPDVALNMDLLARPVATVTTLRWSGPARLTIEGYAYTRYVSDGSQKISVLARRADTGDTLEFPVRRTRTTDAALWANERVRSHENDGFCCELDVEMLRRESQLGQAARTWDLAIRIVDDDIIRETRLDGIWRGGSAAVVGSRTIAGGVVARARTDRGKPVQVEFNTSEALASNIELDGTTVTMQFETASVQRVWLVGSGGLRPVIAQRRPDGAFTAVLPTNRPDTVQTTWRVRARVAGRDQPVIAPNEAGSNLAANAAGARIATEHSGRAAVVVYTRTAVVDEVSCSPAGAIEISGALYALDDLEVGIAPSGGTPASWHPAATHDGRFHASVPLARADVFGVLRPLPCAGYRVVARRRNSVGVEDDTRILVSDGAANNLPITQLCDSIKVKISRASRERISLDVSAPVPDALLGRFAQARLAAQYSGADRAIEDAVFFYVDLGSSACDSARAIHEELRRRGSSLRLYWGVHDHSVAVPEGGVAIIKSSPEWYEKLNRSRYIVNNYGGVHGLVKHSEQRYLQTWHGTPYKYIGVSEARHKNSLDTRYETIAKEASEFDAFVSPSPYMTGLIPTEFLFDGKILEAGYPRNDRLAEVDPVERDSLRARFGIPAGAHTLLYAPTYREGQRHGWRAGLFDGLDLERLQALLGPDWYILLRGHSFNARDSMKSRTAGHLIDVTHHADVNDLYIASDALVTDYSSVMFDYAVTGKPIAYFTPDLTRYVAARGVYFDLEEMAPGPLLSDVVHLAEALADTDALRRQYADRYAAFRTRFAPWDDGKAAARVVDAFFG